MRTKFYHIEGLTDKEVVKSAAVRVDGEFHCHSYAPFNGVDCNDECIVPGYAALTGTEL